MVASRPAKTSYRAQRGAPTGAKAAEVPARARTSAGGLRTQIEALQRQLEEGGILLIDPRKIGGPRFHNRFSLDLDPTDRDFEKLLESIRHGGGNEIPVLLNRLPDGRYEVVYGQRRVRACKIAGVQVRAFVREGLDGKEMARLQILENSDRKAPSIIDRARQVLSQIDSKVKVWDSQAELAGSLGISPQYVNMLLKIARHLPQTLQMAHPDHHRISFRQAKAIADVGERDPAELNRRIEWVIAHKGSLTASAATEHLTRAAGKKPRGAQVSWTSSKNGATLRVRNMGAAQAKQLKARIEELLEEFGLVEAAE